MKIKSIAAICKKNKNIAIFERYSDDGDILTQYIGDGSAVYPVVGLPQLDKESLLTIFDVPEEARLRDDVGRSLRRAAFVKLQYVQHVSNGRKIAAFDEYQPARCADRLQGSSGIDDRNSFPLDVSFRFVCVLEADTRRNAQRFHEVIVAVFLLQAVIMPYDVINQQFVESLQDLTRECEFSLSEKERREREARDRFTFTEPEQCSLNVDPDTGEVVEESEVADE